MEAASYGRYVGVPSQAELAKVFFFYPVSDEDAARLSPFARKHLGVHGTYSFQLPDLAPDAIRELRAPEADDGDDEE